jgi:hypothetical protein
VGDEPRRALSNVGGEVASRGDPAFTFLLAAALEAVTSQADLRDSLTHGFHSYPARMHPAVARVVLEQMWTVSGDRAAVPTVLDPFCGSGTVAVEAMLAKWRSLGSDLNPLAIRLARVKTQRRDAKSRDRFQDSLAAVGRASEARVRGRVDVRAKIPRDELRWYQPHILKELAGLWEEIRKVEPEPDRLAMEMVFSANVVKFSRQAADTRPDATQKRLRKGLVTEFFLRKGRELSRRWADLEAATPSGAKRPRFVLSDARTLPQTLGGEFACDLVLTSPPYGGTYDYVEHHARRYPWLGIDATKLEQQEIGARRRLSKGKAKGHEAMRAWDIEVAAMLAAMAKLMRPEGVAVLLMGDAEVGGRRVPADEQLERLAGKAELEFLAAASQSRTDWHGKAPRREHLVALLRR